MPFKKGVSGNPKGRPKKEREEKFYEILVSEITPDDFREMVKVAKTKAKNGNYAYMKFLFEYLIGPPVERKEISGMDGGTIHVTVQGLND